MSYSLLKGQGVKLTSSAPLKYITDNMPWIDPDYMNGWNLD